MPKSTKEWDEVELKYCERCGGLWLRRRGSERVYCAVCMPKVAELPEASVRVRTVKLPKGDLLGGMELLGLAEGGRP